MIIWINLNLTSFFINNLYIRENHIRQIGAKSIADGLTYLKNL